VVFFENLHVFFLGGSPSRILVFKKIIEKTDGQWRVGLREHRLDEPTWSNWITWNFNEWSVPGPCFGRFRMGLGVVFGMKHWGLDGCKVRNSFFLGVISIKTRSMLEEFSGLGKNIEG
jgi:hypothetical protein